MKFKLTDLDWTEVFDLTLFENRALIPMDDVVHTYNIIQYMFCTYPPTPNCILHSYPARSLYLNLWWVLIQPQGSQ